MRSATGRSSVDCSCSVGSRKSSAVLAEAMLPSVSEMVGRRSAERTASCVIASSAGAPADSPTSSMSASKCGNAVTISCT